MARIIRQEHPPKYYAQYRNYLEYLKKDFKERCAYSMQHYMNAGGWTAMEIDHHNPFLPDRNDYQNLFLATRHCNGHKLQNWPTQEQKDKGIRFLNPCVDDDYGHQIFEDPNSFEVWGSTPAARYHIRKLDLNASHLVEERKLRHEARKAWREPCIVTLSSRAGNEKDAMVALAAMKQIVDRLIPDIEQKLKPPLPADTPSPPGRRVVKPGARVGRPGAPTGHADS